MQREPESIAEMERGGFQARGGFQVACLARLIREYYVRRTSQPPPMSAHKKTAMRDVYPGNQRGGRRGGQAGMTLMAGSFRSVSAFFSAPPG